MPAHALRAAVPLAAALAAAFSIASLGALPAAGATTVHACAGRDATLRLVSRGSRCRPSETPVSWGTELPPRRGSTGGVARGPHGRVLASRTSLLVGQSESGTFAAGAGTSSGELGIGISFARPLATAVGGGHAVFNKPGESSAHCPRTGSAERGYLCLYASESESASFVRTLSFTPFELDATGRFGFAAYFTLARAHGFVTGSWTVTEA
jgi:hypothetical protein